MPQHAALQPLSPASIPGLYTRGARGTSRREKCSRCLERHWHSFVVIRAPSSLPARPAGRAGPLPGRLPGPVQGAGARGGGPAPAAGDVQALAGGRAAAGTGCLVLVYSSCPQFMPLRQAPLSRSCLSSGRRVLGGAEVLRPSGSWGAPGAAAGATLRPVPPGTCHCAPSAFRLPCATRTWGASGVPARGSNKVYRQ